MSRILGLDLGTNSIGWAIVNENKIENIGVKVFSNQTSHLTKQTYKTTIFHKLKVFIKSNFKSILLLAITTSMFLLSILFPVNWQFWINLGVGCLIATLTFSKK